MSRGDTVLVRSLLVPALAYDIGARIWWPSKLGRPGDRRTARRVLAAEEAEAGHVRTR